MLVPPDTGLLREHVREIVQIQKPDCRRLRRTVKLSRLLRCALECANHHSEATVCTAFRSGYVHNVRNTTEWPRIALAQLPEDR